jgi:hypothetical protein
MLEDNSLGKFKERRNKTAKPYERPKVTPEHKYKLKQREYSVICNLSILKILVDTEACYRFSYRPITTAFMAGQLAAFNP